MPIRITCVGSVICEAVRLRLVVADALTVAALAGATGTKGAGAGSGADSEVSAAGAATRSAADTPPATLWAAEARATRAAERSELPALCASVLPPAARAAARLPPLDAGPAAAEESEPDAELVSGPELPSPASALATAQPRADPAPATTPATATPRQISLTFFTLDFSDHGADGSGPPHPRTAGVIAQGFPQLAVNGGFPGPDRGAISSSADGCLEKP